MQPADTKPASARLADRYRVLLDIGRTLSGTLSREDLYRAMYRETAEALEATGFYVSLYDEARDAATVVFYADRGEEREVEVTYRGSESEVIRTGKPSNVPDREAIRSFLVLGEKERETTRSAVSAPLIHKGRVLGAISAQSYRVDAYGPDDVELLQGIADISAVALENARHVEELERRRREAERVEEIGRALTASLDPQDVLGKVIDAALGLVQADGATVWLMEGSVARVASSTGRISLPEGAEWDLRGPLYRRLVQARKPVVIDDLGESDLVPDQLREHLEGGSALAVPLVVGNEVAGALSAGSAECRFFNEDDIHVLQRLAGQASVALQNARLHSSLHALSLTDPLTGLPNRRHLQMHLGREVAAAQRGRALVVVIFDLDDFKEYNDTLGHVAGDDILRAFGQILADENRAMNLVARYGGDEFISVLSDADLEGAEGYLRRVQRRLDNDELLAPHGVTVSCGVACYDEGMRTMEDLIHAADADLYAKKAEKGTR